MGIQVSRYVREGLDCTIDKQAWVITVVIYNVIFNSYATNNL